MPFSVLADAWIIDANGYVPNVEQTSQSLKGIEVGFIWLPAFFLALSMIPVWFYKKYELFEPQSHAELQKRRENCSAKKRVFFCTARAFDFSLGSQHLTCAHDSFAIGD